MKILVDLDRIGIDGKAETLRGLVFKQYNELDDQTYLGCYETFEVNDGFVKIEPQKYPFIYNKIKPWDDDEYPIEVTAFENETLVAIWWWDGDGDLSIWIKGEPCFYQNTDCKHTRDWIEREIKE